MYRVPNQDQAQQRETMLQQSKNSDDFTFDTAEEMQQFGSKLAKLLPAGDVVFLIGDLGSGKTTFAKGIISELCGSENQVTSPTFNLVHVWDAEKFEVWHADLYRLDNPAQVIGLGLEDAFDHALCLIEWPDRMGEMAPDLRLDICFSHHGQGRKVVLRAMGKEWEQRINVL